MRFRLNDPDEKQAAEYLSTLGKSRNQYIVQAVINQICNQDHAPSFSLSDIRKVVREEFQAVALSPSATVLNEAELDPNTVLEDLSIFD